ncbi:Aldo-keto reductase (Fragment) [Babesia microti strain RI]|uniref:Aldo-keto reductase n=1 Tax=Babesia microti (strain RI) TaxID=1133968 RepID=A0A1N6LXA5_BABMR
MSVYSWLLLILTLSRTISAAIKLENNHSECRNGKYTAFLRDPPKYCYGFNKLQQHILYSDVNEDIDNIKLAEEMEEKTRFYIKHEDMEVMEEFQQDELAQTGNYHKEEYLKGLKCWNRYRDFFPEEITIEQFYAKLKQQPLRPIRVANKIIHVYEMGYGIPWYLPESEYEKLAELIGSNEVKYVDVDQFEEFKTQCHNLGGFLHQGGFVELSSERSAMLPYVEIVSVKRNLPDMNYEIILKDTKRDVLFKYYHSKPKMQPSNMKYRPYFPKPLWNPIKYDFYQRKTLDDDIFRQPRVEDLRAEKFSSVNFMKWDPEKDAPCGFYRTYQNFWPTTYTAENKDLPSVKYRKLGNSDLSVSEVGLGTMTFGNSANKETAISLLDYAFDRFQINFFDTSELYPLPVTKDTYGRAEKILGEWIRKRGQNDRDKMVIATKVAGPSDRLGWIRSGNLASTKLTYEQILDSVDNSLDRLGISHIDLLQFHWPDRYYPNQSNPDYENVVYDTRRSSGDDSKYYNSVITAVKGLIKNGKIRAWGLSNETPCGVLNFYRAAMELDAPPPASVQLEYNLLARNDVEKGFVELSRPQNTGIGLVAYSPLAGGLLTGKYLEFVDGTTNARLIKFPSYMARLRGSIASRAVKEYYDISQEYRLPNLTVMALRWVYTRPFINATLIGANDLYQLRESLYCVDEELPMTDMMERHINQVHWKWRDPIRIIQ